MEECSLRQSKNTPQGRTHLFQACFVSKDSQKQGFVLPAFDNIAKGFLKPQNACYTFFKECEMAPIRDFLAPKVSLGDAFTIKIRFFEKSKLLFSVSTHTSIRFEKVCFGEPETVYFKGLFKPKIYALHSLKNVGAHFLACFGDFSVFLQNRDARPVFRQKPPKRRFFVSGCRDSNPV